jgi:OmpA-OmpF porin, OOP family
MSKTAGTRFSSEKERDLIFREFFSAMNGQVTFENRLEVAPPIEAIRTTEPPPTAPTDPVSLPMLRFKLGSTELTDESLPLLDQVAAALRARPGLRLELAAHTDASGSPAYNLDLSTRRAQAVLERLKSKGIDERRLEARGYGETRPLADDLSPQGAELNRRIEFIAIE